MTLEITRRELVRGGLATAGLAASGLPAGAQGQAGVVRLRLLETTDIHVHVLPFDYYRDGVDNTVGLARVATLVEQARAEVRNTLLFDNGDFVQGNPLGDLAAERGLREGDVHPIVRAMNLLRYDAGTLGNHEFNYGLDFLDRALAGAAFPVVCANAVRGTLGASPRADRTYLRPYVVLERQVLDEAGQPHALKIGVIGLVPPQIATWDERHLRGRIEARDMVDAAAAWVPEMRERGCDLIVALAHTGIAVRRRGDRDENAAFHLAQIPGIDVIMTGHQHQLFPGPAYRNLTGVDANAGAIAGVPAVMAGFWGSHLGRIDLTLRREGGRFRVAGHESALVPISRREQNRVVAATETNARVAAAVAVEHGETITYMRRPVGRTSVPLHTYLALVGDSSALQIVTDAQLWYARRLLAGTPHERLPLVSAVAPFRAGGRGGAAAYTDVPAGEIALRNLGDIYVFPNTLKVLRVSGADIRGWLERSAGIFAEIRPTAEEQLLVDAAFPAFNFDVIHGLTYRIDVSKPRRFDLEGNVAAPGAARILDLAYEGRPVAPDMVFAVVSNNYRASGGGRFPGAVSANVILDAPDYSRDVIAQYLQQAGTVSPRPLGAWRFAPVPGAANVVFESAPKAREFLSEVAGVSFVGEGQNGFARFRVDLGA